MILAPLSDKTPNFAFYVSNSRLKTLAAYTNNNQFKEPPFIYGSFLQNEALKTLLLFNSIKHVISKGKQIFLVKISFYQSSASVIIYR